MQYTLIFETAVANLISGLITNLVWIILIYWGIKLLAKKIGDGFSNLIKNIPQWIHDYDNVRMKHHGIDKALTRNIV
jgi:predicted PurR-regulated permease PerM